MSAMPKTLTYLFTEARKAAVAIVGVATTLLTADLIPAPESRWISIAVGVITALLVHQVPNAVPTPAADVIPSADTSGMTQADPVGTPPDGAYADIGSGQEGVGMAQSGSDAGFAGWVDLIAGVLIIAGLIWLVVGFTHHALDVFGLVLLLIGLGTLLLFGGVRTRWRR